MRQPGTIAATGENGFPRDTGREDETPALPANHTPVRPGAVALDPGIRHLVALTRAARGRCVAVPPGVVCQDEAGRLRDIPWLLACAARRAGNGPGARFGGAFPPGRNRTAVGPVGEGSCQAGRRARRRGCP
jgi:hypothetical protein